MSVLAPRERIEQTILMIRGHRVMLDADLAKLYGVTTFNLNKAVKRNTDRFPDDFMFRLSAQESAALTFQIGISKPSGRGGRRYAPYVFTEQGVAMLSSVLRSKRAIQVNIAIMRAFVKLRELAASHKGLATKLAQLERKMGGHDGQIRSLFDAIRQLVEHLRPNPAASDSRLEGSPAVLVTQPFQSPSAISEAQKRIAMRLRGGKRCQAA